MDKPILEDRILSEFLKSLGPWREHVMIGGGFALFIYKLYLSDPKLETVPVGTRDIDSLLPRKIPDVSKKNIAKHLLESGFKHFFKDVDMPPVEGYVKEIEGVEVEIEFLTDSATRKDKSKNVQIAGVIAQPLSYLTLSLQRSKEFRTFSQEVGKVVSPEAWIFHKGLTFLKRTTPSKTLKDLYGIWYVASQLAEFSEHAVNEFSLLAGKHSQWFETFYRNLNRWVSNATPAEWSRLETQDPSGKLKKLHFVNTIKKLLV